MHFFAMCLKRNNGGHLSGFFSGALVPKFTAFGTQIYGLKRLLVPKFTAFGTQIYGLKSLNWLRAFGRARAILAGLALVIYLLQ